MSDDYVTPIPKPAPFSIRVDEERDYSRVPPVDGNAYLVMIHPVPAFPGEYHKHDYPEMAVLCAARYATLNGGPERKWGWIHLDSITKDVIGEDLVSIAAEPDVWYYMTVSNGYGEARAEKSSDEI